MAKHWYVLQTYTGYENKVSKGLRVLMQEETVAGVLTDVKVPSEEVVEIRDGKKRVSKRLFLPSYLLLEMDLPGDSWKLICSRIRHLNGVTGFVGTGRDMRPQPISQDEARSILQKTGEIDGEKISPKFIQAYTIGETVRIIDGPFESFTGDIEELNVEKSRMRVMVGIFGRATPVEVNFLQVEKI